MNALADWLHEHTAGFAAAVRGIDPELRVPTCPEWRVRELVGHVGQAFGWAAGLVTTGQAAPVPDPREADPGPPAAWAAWLRGRAALLTEAVAESPHEAVWTFFGPQPPRFWLRRMLCDLVVHHYDAANAARRPFLVQPEVAAETITEGLELITRPEAVATVPALANLVGTGQRLFFRPTDLYPGWLVTRDPDRVRWERGGGEADVVVTGPVRELLLVCTRRLDPERVTVTGDRALLADWLKHLAY